MKFEVRLDHGYGDGYLLDARLHSRLNDAGKNHLERKNPEGKTLENAEGMTTNTSNT